MLPLTVLRRFGCVPAPTKSKVIAEHEKRKSGKVSGAALDRLLNNADGQRFHNHSPLTFEKFNGGPDNSEKHLVFPGDQNGNPGLDQGPKPTSVRGPSRLEPHPAAQRPSPSWV